MLLLGTIAPRVEVLVEVGHQVTLRRWNLLLPQRFDRLFARFRQITGCFRRGEPQAIFLRLGLHWTLADEPLFAFALILRPDTFLLALGVVDFVDTPATFRGFLRRACAFLNEICPSTIPIFIEGDRPLATALSPQSLFNLLQFALGQLQLG